MDDDDDDDDDDDATGFISGFIGIDDVVDEKEVCINFRLFTLRGERVRRVRVVESIMLFVWVWSRGFDLLGF